MVFILPLHLSSSPTPPHFSHSRCLASLIGANNETVVRVAETLQQHSMMQDERGHILTGRGRRALTLSLLQQSIAVEGKIEPPPTDVILVL